MSALNKILNIFKINGIIHKVEGSHVSFKNNKVYINDKEIAPIKETHLKIEWIGELANLDINYGDVSCENVAGDVEAEGDVTCKNVTGDIQADTVRVEK